MWNLLSTNKENSLLPALLMILTVAILNVISQSLFKKGVASIGGLHPKDLLQPFQLFYRMLTCLPIVTGIVISIGVNTLWLLVLSRVSLVVAIPLSNAFFYLFLIAASFFLFNETVTLKQVSAIVLILIGISLL